MACDLTPKQEAFCFAYVETGNASEAYRRAYDTENMSVEAIKAEAYKLRGHPDITLTIESLRNAQRRRHALTADRVLAEYAKIAFADAGDIFEWGPDGIRVKSVEDLTPDQRALVSEVSQTTTQHGGTIRVKLYDKLDALEKIGRHLGIFEKDNAQSGKAAGDAAGKAIGEGVKQLTDLQFARWLAFKLAQGANANAAQAPTDLPEA